MGEKWLKYKKTLFPNLFSTEDMIKWLKIKGIEVGEGTTFYAPGKITIDISRPCLLKIGEYCKITSGVIILTHDYSRSVLRRTHGQILGEAGKTVIGNNVFIGMNAIILMGSQIGDNVIVGAGSVISGVVPDNVVVAGNPAKIIRTIEEHYEIRRKKTLEEAVGYANAFYAHYHRIPTIKELDPFYPLFLERDISKVQENNLTIKLGGDNYDEVVNEFLNSQPVFNGYDDFIKHCKLPTENK
ncbi:MAG: acyltransferase [Oscillospiraceae bacterium]